MNIEFCIRNSVFSGDSPTCFLSTRTNCTKTQGKIINYLISQVCYTQLREEAGELNLSLNIARSIISININESVLGQSACGCLSSSSIGGGRKRGKNSDSRSPQIKQSCRETTSYEWQINSTNLYLDCLE
ncbi:hypothetical protein CFAEC_12300 [Corynebacterium faecale]|nr:hypothetical protein CFAEC_12300 [Corynebacterium faecale]